jgi:hypothetical protein
MIGRYSAPKQYTNRAEYTSSNNFTVPAGITQLRVTVSGGAGVAYAATNSENSAPGGPGQLVVKEIQVTPGQVISYVVGAVGGTSSFGAYITAAAGTSASALRSTTGSVSGATNFGGGNGSFGAGYIWVEW